MARGDGRRADGVLHGGGNSEVVKYLEGQFALGLEDGAWATAREIDEVERPEHRDQPFDGVFNRVAVAVDLAFGVNTVAGSCDDAGVDGDDGIGLHHEAVEDELHPSLADEVAGVFVGCEVTDEVAAIRERASAVAFGVAEGAHDRVADFFGLRGDFVFSNSAVDDRSGWDELIAISDGRGGCEKQGQDERYLQGKLHEKRDGLSTGGWRRQLLRFVHRDAHSARIAGFREADCTANGALRADNGVRLNSDRAGIVAASCDFLLYEETIRLMGVHLPDFPGDFAWRGGVKARYS